MRKAAGVRILGTLCLLAGLTTVGFTAPDERRGDQLTFSDGAGVQRTVTTAGSFDEDNPFFQSLGTNGRSCFTCHQPDQAWTVTPAGIRERFEQTRGRDPIFRSNDGSTCQDADISTTGKRRAAFSLLLIEGSHPRRPARSRRTRSSPSRTWTTRTIAARRCRKPRCSGGRCRRRISAS